MEKSIAGVLEQLYRKLEPEEVNTLVQALETNVQAARDRLRDHQEKFENLTKEIKVSQICESAEERLDHAESTRFLVMTRILNLLDGFVNTRRSVQSVKSESHVVLINMKLRYRYRPC